jgi:tetratricopeptide (TPR) repeat protein
MRECARIRSQVAERFAANDHQGALDACSRQIELSAALLRLLDRVEDEILWRATVVTYNHAVASEAFGLWCCGRPAIAEEVIESAATRHALPADVFPARAEADRREMVAEMVAEHGWELFARGKWREASCAFQFARIQGYERVDGPNNRNAVELLAREAICAFNDRNFPRAYELFTAVICRFPGEDVRGIRILREKAHQAKVLGDSARLYEKAAHAFKVEDWVGSAVRYRDAADFIEYREHPELLDLAAECYYNAAMAMCNCRRFREARRILRYVQRAYPNHEPNRVAERLRQVDRLVREHPNEEPVEDGPLGLELLAQGDGDNGAGGDEGSRKDSDALQRVSTIEALAAAAHRWRKRD